MKIGTVELLKPRVYQLDAYAHELSASTVVVQPGTYDLHRDGDTTYWMMRGTLNRRLWHIGDGAFMVSDSDEPSDVEVVFPSRRFGPDEWADLMASPEFAEGRLSQRLRVTIESAEVSA